MKTIELNCQDNGRINFAIKRNDRLKYATYNEVIDEIINTANDKVATKIVDGNIYFRNNYVTIIIKNYRNNRDEILSQVINRIKKLNQIQKKNRLKKQKIKRIRTFAGVTILSLGIAVSASLISNNDKNKVENEITYTNNYEHNFNKNSIDDQIAISDEIINDEEEELGQIIEIEVEPRTETDKFIETKENYYDRISKISTEYGIDPRIMLAIATQETGEHIINTNTPALGLMQIEISVWDGQSISAYNFKDEQNENILVTKEKLKDLDFNIRVACMHFQNCLKNSNYDINVAIQMYNFGYGNIQKTFKLYHNNNSLELSDSLKEYNDDWLNYREYITAGDKYYLEHIVSYIEDLESIKCKKENNESVIYTYKTKSLGHKI